MIIDEEEYPGPHTVPIILHVDNDGKPWSNPDHDVLGDIFKAWQKEQNRPQSHFHIAADGLIRQFKPVVEAAEEANKHICTALQGIFDEIKPFTEQLAEVNKIIHPEFQQQSDDPLGIHTNKNRGPYFHGHKHVFGPSGRKIY